MDPIQQIKEKLDIVDVIKEYIPLTPAGKNFKAVCPFHKEKTPSFVVSPDRQSWHCFGSCAEGGDVISFVMKYEGVEFYEALKALAEKAGVQLQHISPATQKEFGVLYDIMARAQEYFSDRLVQSTEATTYIKERGLRDQTIEEFTIGYAPQEPDGLTLHLINAGYAMRDIERSGMSIRTERGTYIDRFRGRIMFPLANAFGKTVAFSGRILPQLDNDHTGKYINSPETPIFNKSHILYGLDKAKHAIKEEKTALIVEGQMDLLMLHQEGVRYAVATSGTALTTQHMQVLSKIATTLIMAFDGDEAGIAATERAIDMAHTFDFSVKILVLPDAKDAAEFIQKNPGAIASTIITTAVPAFDYYFNKYLTHISPDTMKSAVRALLEKIILTASPLEQGRWIKKIADTIAIPEQSVFEEVQLLKKKHILPRQPAVPSPVVAHEPTSRLEKLASQIVFLSCRTKHIAQEAHAYRAYFPAPYGAMIESLDTTTHVSLDVHMQEALQLIDMQQSLGDDGGDEEKNVLEGRFLLQELKKEYLKERRTQIMHTIKKIELKEENGNVQELLTEFDELAKLIDN